MIEAARAVKREFLKIPPKVLQDLALFCFAGGTSVAYRKDGSVDAQQTLVNEGRRQVWNRIAQRLELTVEELYQLCRGNPIGERE